LSLFTEFVSLCGLKSSSMMEKPNRTEAISNSCVDGYPILHFDSVRLCIAEQVQEIVSFIT
jgi:hypothetical protein